MRVVLETPLWSYIGDRNLRPELERMAAARRIKICTPPSVLIEVLRTPRPDVRSRIIDGLSSRHWQRLPIDSLAECSDTFREIARLRPYWIRQEGARRVDRLARVQRFWTRDVWRIARENPARLLAQLEPLLAKPYTDYAESHRRARSFLWEAGDQNVPPENIRWSLRGETDFHLGWRGDPLEPWRVEGCDTYWSGMVERPHLKLSDVGKGLSLVDWTDGHVWPDRVRSDRASFNEFGTMR